MQERLMVLAAACSALRRSFLGSRRCVSARVKPLSEGNVNIIPAAPGYDRANAMMAMYIRVNE
jgi:hypothetical protein